MSGTLIQLDDYRSDSGLQNEVNTTSDAEVILLPNAKSSVRDMEELLNGIIQSCHPDKHDCCTLDDGA